MAEVFQLRSAGFAAITRHATAIDSLAAALADIDTALQLNIDCRSIDEQQVLVTSARRLAAMLESGAA